MDIASAFGKSPVKRMDNKKPQVNIEIPSDDEFEKSIVNIEEDLAVRKSPRKTPKKTESQPEGRKTPPSKPERSPEPKKASQEKSSTSSRDTAMEQGKSPARTPVAKPAVSSTRKSAKKKEVPVDLESSVQNDEDRHERKQMTAALYQKYKNRANCLNHGCKEIPKGRPNCLAGKVFLVTGVLESLERGEAEELIKEYGGKISSGVTKKLNFMVTGEDAGPSKLTKAEDYGVKIVSEDDLLDMIRGGPAAKKEEQKKSVPSVKSEEKGSPPKKESQENKMSPGKQRIKMEPNEEFQSFKVNKKVKLEESPGPSKPQLEKPACDERNLAWVDKYKPTSIKQIIGQQGPSSNTNK